MIVPVVAAIFIKHGSGLKEGVSVALLTKHGECECEGCVLKDRYEFPGGKVDEGESLIDALIREIKEELDIDITNLNLLFTPSVIHAQINKYEHSPDEYLVIYFELDLINGIDESKLPEHVWVTLESIEVFDTLPGSVEALTRIFLVPSEW